MRKEILLPVLALAGGSVGFLLRRWQLSAALDVNTGLFVPGHPATLILLALTAGMAALFLVLCRGGRRQKEAEALLLCPDSAYMTIMVAGAALLAVSAALGALEFAEGFALWRQSARYNPLPIMDGLCVLLSLPAAWSVLVMSRGSCRGALPAASQELITLPAYAALPWLVSAYQDHSRQPQLLQFGFQIMAVILLLLSLYLTAAILQKKPRPAALSFCSLLGIYLGLLSLGDGLSRADIVRQCAFMLIVFGNLFAVLCSVFGPARLARPTHHRQTPDHRKTSAPDAAGEER